MTPRSRLWCVGFEDEAAGLDELSLTDLPIPIDSGRGIVCATSAYMGPPSRPPTDVELFERATGLDVGSNEALKVIQGLLHK